ncbi:glycosyltransferase family 2 protein [Wenxinia marina]|nr:glycosyltransferase family 2 protein [Wenxinia marina]
MALISVILPVHDAVDYLPTAAASLSAQSHSDFEIIAIDDGSTDGSGQVLERWKAREPRLRTMRRENRGLISTLNEAIGMASGRYLARMDADDFAFASRLGAQFDAFSEDPNLVVCGTNFVTLLPNGRAIPADPDVQTSHRELRIASRFYTSLRHPTVMIDRERAGPEPIYDKAYPHAEDF